MTVQEFLALVTGSSQQKNFFHFTDTRNLPLIRQHGILSMRESRRLAIDVPACGGNDWSLDADVQCGMDAYVHLCLMQDHPMEYIARRDRRIVRTKFLAIRPEVILLPGVLMTTGVSNKSDVLPQAPEVVLGSLDLEVVYQRTDWKNPSVRSRRDAAKKYEVLVPTRIPLNMVTNLSDG